ncbi:iron-sulfur cluster assembly protein 1-like [Diospyros lotus]|uniref:iron-sulfur cluster assembly protein 1-like n=1 Tax=Diospyros lotus TaxID=55363 RepID=UPI0022514AA4|nr:iron-sulfur cluster assembly protein 1-like [Diospyros lotus]XP_052180238.1 iron-sulfur cluster assembly protein 1-like [Diospyros lotus]
MLRTTAKNFLGLGFRNAQTHAKARSSSTQLQLLVRLYHERVVDHYNHPRNVGSFKKDDPTVGTGLVGAPACGDVMKLQIRVDEQSGKIVDACFKTFGCGSAIASSSVATEWVKGKQMEEVLSIKNTEIAKHLSLPPVKLHCSMLAEDAIKAAVKDYEAKRSPPAAGAAAAADD